MKKLILILAVVGGLTACSTVDKVLISKSGQDDPATTDVDESIVVNPMVEGAMSLAQPVASTVPFGSLIYSGIATALGAFVEIKRRKTKTATKAVAIAVEQLVSSELGKSGTATVKAHIKKKASELGVERELNKIVKEVS